MCQFIKKFFTNYESEEFFQQIKYTNSPEQICYSRTQNCLEWYARKAILYKRLFYILSLVNITVPLVSAVIMAINDNSNIGMICAAITSLSASLLALYNARDKWVTYRTAAEHIKSQYALYCAKVLPYNEDDAHSKYLLLLEKYMAAVHSYWYNTQKSGESNDGKENTV